QYPAADSNEEGCSLAAGPAPRRGHRRPDRLWTGRYFPRSGRMGGRIHTAPVMDRRRNNITRPSCDALPQSWALMMRRVFGGSACAPLVAITTEEHGGWCIIAVLPNCTDLVGARLIHSDGRSDRNEYDCSRTDAVPGLSR